MNDPTHCYYCVEVEARQERVAQIRRILSAHLKYWKLDLQVAPVCQGVDELLLNVVAHADEKNAVVELWWNGKHLIASVSDNDGRPPRLLGPARGGLAKVAALSDGWGTCGTRGGGKLVWFTRRVEAAERLPLSWPIPSPVLREAKHRPKGLPALVPVGVPAEGRDTHGREAVAARALRGLIPSRVTRYGDALM
ncbi:ATP-binding protein [Streptomyces sp. NPDC058001]|uniref:ATP-binding protein n=1 Tax=Streptomyces sp. NPDC058001 TaxID=3346300 RepID=UPI0036F0F236